MKRRKQSPAAAAGIDPPELVDPSAEVWHNQQLYHRFMADRGWMLPPSERFRVPTHPENRRWSAAGEWALENGVNVGGFPDWNRLRELGVTGRNVAGQK